ncbi:MAG: delta-60 repeat domain-containing protein [Chloroflexia bacterium]
MTAPTGKRRSNNKPNKYNPPNFIITSLAAVTLLFSAACGESPQPTPDPGSNTNPTRAQSLPTNAARPTRPNSQTSLVGELDPTFGDGGKVTNDFGSDTEEIRDIAVRPDGKIVVLGETWPKQLPRFTLARYNPDGTLDEDFGDGGLVVTETTDQDYNRGTPHALLLQPDGKIVVGGGSTSPDYNHGVFAVMRYNEDGTLDEEFGHAGRVTTALNEAVRSSSADELHALALQPDGKIVAAGITGEFPPDMGVARFNPDGTLDDDFGDGGKVVLDIDGSDDGAYAVAVQEDGKIVVGGYASSEGGVEFKDFALVRLNEDGTPDEEFGDAGKVRTELGIDQEDAAHAIVVHPDGKITLAGPSVVGPQQCTTQVGICWRFGYGLAQYYADGTLDDDFGNDGIVTRDLLYSAANYALVRLPDGKLATGGYVSRADFALALFNPDGTQVESFGDKGVARTAFGTYSDYAYALALQPDGKLLLAGTAVVDPDDILNGDFAIARYR